MTEFPFPRIWGLLFRIWKSLEVLIFKIIQMLGGYRPQKTVIGIPSLATRRFTSLQAVVFNGTHEDVLGFRSRRPLQRILKGLPALESFERLRFQLSVDESRLRTVDASTELRGFLHLQVPWSLPWTCPDKSYLRVTPLGVETVLGPVKLGTYQISSCPVFFLTEKTRWIVLTDIDDTIKDSNIAKTTGFRQIVSAIVKGNYYTYQAIEGMSALYRELADRGAMVIYLTSTPFQLAPFLLKFLRDSGFPEGPVFPRWLGYNRFGHKWRILHRLLSNTDSQKFALIGDSGEQDLAIYRRIADNEEFGKRVERVLIRHVPGTQLLRTLHQREAVYGSLAELRTHLGPLLNP